MYIADFHIHSRYSYATSKTCTLEYLDLWARRKGIHIVGTGDFTHPARCNRDRHPRPRIQRPLDCTDCPTSRGCRMFVLLENRMSALQVPAPEQGVLFLKTAL